MDRAESTLRCALVIISRRLLFGILGIASLSQADVAFATEPVAVIDSRRAAPRLTVPSRPDEPRAAKAYDVLETHCARCHQTGRLERPLASGGLADILSIDELARDPVLVRPGLPDASRLYDVFETRHSPLDVFSGTSGAAEPQPEDIESIRGWIRDLQPRRRHVRHASPCGPPTSTR